MADTARPGSTIDAAGPVGIRTTIKASRCSDEGACIMCVECGHIFVESQPLSDESEPAYSTDLARALWTHVCDRPGRRSQGPVSHERKSQRR